MRGRNGRLFLDNDTNLVIAQHRGQLRFSDAQLRQWRFVLETRVAKLRLFRVPELLALSFTLALLAATSSFFTK